MTMSLVLFFLVSFIESLPRVQLASVESKPRRATAGAAVAGGCAGLGGCAVWTEVAVLTVTRGAKEKRQTVSPYREPAMVARRSARISPDFASSDALVLRPAMQLHQCTVGDFLCCR